MTEATSGEHSQQGVGRNFVVFFEEKEGTTAIVRYLSGFPQVDVVRARGRWEPFDRHTCGTMPLSSLRECLDLVFSRASVADVNRIYKRTATRALSKLRGAPSLGFKMHYQPTIVDVLTRHRVLVFIAARQDVFRWALSKYHGDGTGRRGHLQFRLASGDMARQEIPRITVDPDALEQRIEACEALHGAKRRLAADLRAAGLDVVPLRYEDFVAKRAAFFTDLLAQLGHEPSPEEMHAALARDIRLRRVHGDDLSEFFVNAAELEARFGDRFERWS